MQTISHIVKVLDKDGRIRTYQTSTANAAEDHNHIDVIHHFTRERGKRDGVEDLDRARRFFGKNFDKIISVERGMSKYVPKAIADAFASGKLPEPIAAALKPSVEGQKLVTDSPASAAASAASTSSAPSTGSKTSAPNANQSTVTQEVTADGSAAVEAEPLDTGE